MRYCHALQALNAELLAEISDFIMDPPQYGKYEALKTHVLHEFRDSEDKRWRTLLNQENSGSSVRHAS